MLYSAFHEVLRYKKLWWYILQQNYDDVCSHWMLRVSLPESDERLISYAKRPDRIWGLSQPHFQWIPCDLSLGVRLISHLHLVLRLRISGALLSFPHTPLWRAQGLRFLNITVVYQFSSLFIYFQSYSSILLPVNRPVRLFEGFGLLRNVAKHWDTVYTVN